MKARSKQLGFSPVEVILVVVVVAVIGLLGYVYYNNQAKKTTSNENSQTSSQSATASDVKSAPAINSTSDLDSAQTALDQTDLSSSNDTDANQLDAEVTNF